MKIAYIATSQIPSTKANSIQVMKVCQALTQNGDLVHLYIPGQKQIDWDVLSKHYGISESFPISWLPSRPGLKRLDFTLKSLQHAKRGQSEVIYTRMLWVAWIADLLRMPVILEMHDLPTGRTGPWLYIYFLRSPRKKLVVYITKGLKDLTDQTYHVKAQPEEWVIAPDGVDLARYTSLPDCTEARRKLDLPEKMTAAYSGGFYQGRGLESLLELARSFAQIQFMWIGGTSEQVGQWKQKLASGGINNVVLTGFVTNDQLPLYQAAAEILLMPYGRQFGGSGGGNIAAVSSPMKLFEYMAAGRAILTSDIPVLREVLNETNALFYTPEDVEDLQLRFSELLSDERKRKSIAEKAREDVRGYEWKTRMKHIMQAFNQR